MAYNKMRSELNKKGSMSKLINGVLVVFILFFVYKLFNLFRGNLNNTFGFDSFKDNPFVAGNSTNQINTQTGIKKLIDEVVDALDSNWNYVGNYDPDTVNRLANLNKNALTFAVQYYNSKYKNIKGLSLYAWLNSEWSVTYLGFGDNVYQPAINNLKKYGLTH